MKVKDQVQQLLAALNSGIQEKETAMSLALLAAVAGESIFLLGAPGVAKSLLARRLKFAFKEGKAFEYLMNRFSTPDEIYGPVAISKLKEDQYVRIVDDYLPGATVVFLDEIWKAGPSIQNALLTVLNEKVYRNGAQEVKLPLKAILAASNELPAEGEGLDALWDRFLIRLKLAGIKDQKAFNKMVSSTDNPYVDDIPASLKISAAQYEAWGKSIDQVKVPENVFQVIHMVRAYLQDHNKKQQGAGIKAFYVSDRRWRKLIRLLRTSAFLNGRQAVDLMDCFLILHCIWDEEGQIQVVESFVKDAVEKHGYKLKLNLKDLEAELKDLDKEVVEETSFLKPVQKEQLKVYENEYCLIPEHNNHFVKVTDFESLSLTEDRQIKLYSKRSSGFDHSVNQIARKGNRKSSVCLKEGHYYEGKVYDLEKENLTEQIKCTRKPHPSTKKHFDAEVQKSKSTIANLLEELHTYRQRDLQHLRINLFVDASLAEVVESNLQILEKQLQKLDIEADRIKKYYETVADQSK
jgi:MoxR-like ATPase